MPKLKKSYLLRTYGQTDPNYRKASLLKVCSRKFKGLANNDEDIITKDKWRY